MNTLSEHVHYSGQIEIQTGLTMKATIIGGGITGLTTAILLQKLGIDFHLYEAVPQLKPVGAGIILSPNALYIYDQIGILDVLEQAGHPLPSFDIADENGRIIQKNETQFHLHGRHYQSIAIHRADLQHILFTHVPTNKITLGRPLQSIDTNSLQLTFSDGMIDQTDYILACDGTHSVARKTLFPNTQLRYSGQTCWRGVAPTQLTSQQLNSPAELWGLGTRFGYVPLSPDTTYWYATAVQPSNQPSPTKLGPHLTMQYNHYPTFVNDIISATAESTIIQHDLYDLNPLKAWAHTNTLLLGDAAHAMTPNLGQGAAQGIEDAWAIANCLKAAPTYQEAFIACQKERMPKATQVYRASKQMGHITNMQNKLLCILRNTLFRALPQKLADRPKTQLFTTPSYQLMPQKSAM